MYEEFLTSVTFLFLLQTMMPRGNLFAPSMAGMPAGMYMDLARSNDGRSRSSSPSVQGAPQPFVSFSQAQSHIMNASRVDIVAGEPSGSAYRAPQHSTGLMGGPSASTSIRGEHTTPSRGDYNHHSTQSHINYV